MSRWLRSDERGIALVVTMLVMMVVVSLSVAVVQLSLHETSVSNLDQRRLQAVNAAETGVNRWLTTVGGSVTWDDLCHNPLYPDAQDGGVPSVLSTSPRVQYTLGIQFQINGQVDVHGDPVWTNCSTGSATPIVTAALVTSTGVAGTATSNSVAVTRKIQEQVNLTRIYGEGVRKALYAGNDLEIASRVFVRHFETTNDADIYSGGSVVINNYLDLQGSIYAQGTVTFKGCIEGDIYAKGTITGGAAYVGACNSAAQPGAEPQSGVNIYPGWGYVTSSQGAIDFAVGAWAYGTCTGKTGVTKSYCSNQRKPTKPSTPAQCGDTPLADPLEACGYVRSSPDPPVVPFPVMSYAASNWTARGYEVEPYTSATCATAQADLNTYLSGVKPATWGSLTGDHVIRVAGSPCALGLYSGSLRGNLAVINDGSIDTPGNAAITSTGGSFTLFAIRPTNGTPNLTPPLNTPVTCGAPSGVPRDTTNPVSTQEALPSYDQRYAAKTNFSGIKFFTYTPCSIWSYNTTDMGGQMIAGRTLYAKNSFDIGFATVEVPDLLPMGYSAAPVVIREISAQ